MANIDQYVFFLDRYAGLCQECCFFRLCPLQLCCIGDTGEQMIQIIGTKKCKETAKALRFCKERSIAFQFVDLSKRGLSDGELDSILSQVDEKSLVDTSSPYYVKNGYAYREFSVREEVAEHPLLLKTPIIRHKGKAIIGMDPDMIQKWGKA